MGLLQGDRTILRFLKYGPIVRRSGQWRFGTRRIGDSVVDRLIANGAAVRAGDEVRTVTAEAAE